MNYRGIIQKEQRKDRILEALGPVLDGADPNLLFIPTADVADTTNLPLSTAKRLLEELWTEKLVEAHTGDYGREWSHKCP